MPIGSWSIFSGVPAFSIASAYSFDCTPAYSIARSDRNGASGLFERDLDRVVVDLVDRLQELRHAHVVEVRVVGARHLEVGVRLPSTAARSMKIMSSALKSRVGFQARWLCHLTPLRRWNVYTLPSGEMVQLSASPGTTLRAAALEVDDAAVDLAVGVERRARGVDRRVEVLRAAFRAEDERLGRQRRRRRAARAAPAQGEARAARRKRRGAGSGFVMDLLLSGVAARLAAPDRRRRGGRAPETSPPDGRLPAGRRAGAAPDARSGSGRSACGQRVAKTQPGGGSSGDGSSPLSTMRSRRMRPMPGVEASSACV